MCSNSMGIWKGWWQDFSCFISLQLSASSTKSGMNSDYFGHRIVVAFTEQRMLSFPQLNWQVKKIFEFLKNGFQEISNSLDLSFEDDSVADEKIPFLAYLASMLKEKSFFPYEPPSGSKHFRSLIAGFLKAYHHVPLSAEVVLASLVFCYINYF